MGNNLSVCLICESYIPPQKLAEVYGETFHQVCLKELHKCPKCLKQAYYTDTNECLDCGHTLYICSDCDNFVENGVIDDGIVRCKICNADVGEPDVDDTTEENTEIAEETQDLPELEQTPVLPKMEQASENNREKSEKNDVPEAQNIAETEN